jgi:hydrogenase expression/formation protein HypC
MCLGVPGRILSVEDGALRTGRVDFDGVVREVMLSYVPEARPGDYVLVHVGFALSVVDEEEARRVLELIAEMEEAR